MKKDPIKKVLGKLDNTLPGLSEILYDGIKKNTTKKEQAYLKLGAGLYLNAKKDEKAKSGKRRQFPKLTKEKVLKMQKNRCKLCGKKSDVWDFDHIDGDKSNNDISNCQALCPNCHAKKTRKNPENS